MTDPIADMLTRLRNASAAKHETVDMPYSKFKANIAEILKREGYIKDFTAKEAKVGQTLEVTLKYGPNGERSIQGIKRISKPGLRRYAKSDALPMPLGGLGIAIISTSSGCICQGSNYQSALPDPYDPDWTYRFFSSKLKQPPDQSGDHG